ncbi:MAG TPA: antitoxin family protein [Planctomycetaceae bacterium]|nr:antitoxin family protein [Planctomycetaceae bacterium]
MTTTVEAIYENGVLRPLQPLPLKEDQRVTVTVEEPQPDQEAMRAWLERLAASRARMREKHGELPDSTLSIREDRNREI